MALYAVPLLGTRSTPVIVVAMVLGYGVGQAAMMGAQAAFLSELFETRYRFSGIATARGQLPRGVSLVNGHGRATAEWAVTALFADRRGLPECVSRQRDRRWLPQRTPGLQGAHVVVLGAGDVGQQIRRRLQAFDALVTLVARTKRSDVQPLDMLDTLLPQADAAVLALPLTDETRGLVDAAFLAVLPAGSTLVNAARGALVDTDALVAELESGRLRAALDVTDPEPLPVGHPLWNAPNLLLTPHVGGDTQGTVERSWAVMREQLLQAARGERPMNLVDGAY